MTIFSPFGPPRPSRRAILAYTAVFGTIAAVLFALAWNSVCVGFLSDDGVYLLMADALSPFHGTDTRLHGYILRQSIFPPGYPLLLSVLGGGSDHLLWSHIVTTSTLVIGLLVMWRWLSLETGSVRTAFGAVAVYALLPGTLLHDTALMSEFPYLLLTTLAIWLTTGSRPSGDRVLSAALCISLAAITRSAGYSLVLAAFVWMIGKGLDRKLRFLGVLVAPLACCYLYQHVGTDHPQRGYDQLWGALIARAANEGMLHFWPRYALGQFIALWDGLLGNLTVVPSVAAPILAIVLLITSLPVWVARLRRWELDAWYLGIAGAVTLIYPFPEHFIRLVVPLVPIVVAYSFLCVQSLASRFGSRPLKQAFTIGLPLLCIACLLPSLSFLVDRSGEPLEPALASWKRTQYWYRFADIDEIRTEIENRQLIVDIARQLRDHVPENECILAARPALVMVYSHRVVVSPPQPSRITRELMTGLLAECSNLFLLGSPGHVAQEPVPAYYPGGEISADNTELVFKWDNPAKPEEPMGLLIRYRPDK